MPRNTIEEKIQKLQGNEAKPGGSDREQRGGTFGQHVKGRASGPAGWDNVGLAMPGVIAYNVGDMRRPAQKAAGFCRRKNADGSSGPIWGRAESFAVWFTGGI